MASLTVAASAPTLLKTRLFAPHKSLKHPSYSQGWINARRVDALAVLATANVSTGAVCHLTPELVSGTTCSLFPDLVESATCELAPALALGPCCSLTPADVGLEDGDVPTPVLPSGSLMAEFLLAYRRVLEHECDCGDRLAAAGEGVLERVRVGLNGLLHHPLHGASSAVDWSWRKDEDEVESCLWELQKDMHMFQRYHNRVPAPIAVKLTGLHCVEAARLLRRL